MFTFLMQWNGIVAVLEAETLKDGVNLFLDKESIETITHSVDYYGQHYINGKLLAVIIIEDYKEAIVTLQIHLNSMAKDLRDTMQTVADTYRMIDKILLEKLSFCRAYQKLDGLLRFKDPKSGKLHFQDEYDEEAFNQAIEAMLEANVESNEVFELSLHCEDLRESIQTIYEKWSL